MVGTIQPAQIKTIHTLVAKLSLSDDDYRATLWHNFQVSSSTELSYEQADGLIKHMKREAIGMGVWQEFQRQPKKRATGTAKIHRYKYANLEGRSSDFATCKQLRFIDVLWHTVSRQKDAAARDEALKIFLQNRFKIPAMENIMAKDVSKIVAALQQMQLQANKQQQTQHNYGKFY